MMSIVSERIENIVEKEENAGYQHFLLFPQCFQKPGLLKLKILFSRVEDYLSRVFR